MLKLAPLLAAVGGVLGIRISAVIMASGRSLRFHGDKLWAELGGTPLIERALLAIPEGVFERVVVVSGDDRILELAGRYGFIPVKNTDTTDDTAVTIRLGMENAGDCDGCAFLVGDQPLLTSGSVAALAELFRAEPQKICVLCCKGRLGNPVIFPAHTFDSLRRLAPGERGKAVMSRFSESVLCCEARDALELEDVDYESELARLSAIIK